ncbi:MAG: putative cytosolic protein [Candidatus Uhrbacteria bacterium GW2011_GWF2_39_13]|uniref:Putative cytosolic protein n=1 Tax=Candidatus Uhrbacteria bacterium GW2011_GWF2_39_13 TaxID=1618995 RepID=A0A0G0MK17_9BACT|nr:MAG: putative cytosolic protein [Candidatus Uhrbacteria bacterium GW2011_GWF2_39_13]
MKISREKVASLATLTGFHADMVEKAVRLINLLNTINTHPALKGKLALKGGTALNLFIFDIPRLSVDIDLNYIGAGNLNEMQVERPKIEQAIQAVFSREDYNLKRMPDEHAGGKWRLGYQNAFGHPGNLEVDLNFMFRIPLWEITISESRLIGEYQSKNIPVLDINELAAGKLAALFSRHQARDIFDARELLSYPGLDQKKLRLAFIVYGAMNRKDWRTVSIEDISFDLKELEQMLLPVLNKNKIEQVTRSSVLFGEKLIDECRKKLTHWFPFSNNESAFLNAILERGEIKAELITKDLELQNRISNQ